MTTTISASCPCGATFSITSASLVTVVNIPVAEFMDRHASCPPRTIAQNVCAQIDQMIEEIHADG